MRWAALAMTLLGCSADDQTSVTCAANATTCANYDGPLQTGDLSYESGARGTCGQCAPRCGVAKTTFGEPSAAALPSGSCTGNATCDFGARLVCACPEARGPVNGYRCSCESGQWRCRMVSQGGSPCGNDACDAGITG